MDTNCERMDRRPAWRGPSWLVLIVGVSALALALGCGGDSDGDNGSGPGGGDPPPAGGGNACSGHGDCADGFFCSFGAAKNAFQCFDDCAFDCDFFDEACEEQCAEDCGLNDMSCDDLCADACGGNAACTTQCVRDCEAGGEFEVSGPGPEPVPGTDPAPGTDPGPGATPPPAGDCRSFCEAQCAGVPLPTCVNECVAACEDDDPPPGGGGGGQGVCRPVPSGGSWSSTEPGPGPGPATEPPPADISWAGSWVMDLQYSLTCENGRRGDQDHSITARLQGGNDDLTLTVSTGSHQMTGVGTNSGLTLNGQLPVMDHNNNVARTSSSDTRLTVRITNVESASRATGTISGTFQAQFLECTIDDGATVTMTR
ncbi:MAG: hypothetical protein EA398_11080 [Deltaproteobacteria bacterium]|nr:MAG: hypothetical protein EA398_11080 [Deltaproteobacteria bacterium]